MSDIFRSYHSILENANVLRRKEATRLCIAGTRFCVVRMDRGVRVFNEGKERDQSRRRAAD